ncbi:MAG: cofactor-independent phosphoglycerate mutase [Anaerovoracaceae bacterium]
MKYFIVVPDGAGDDPIEKLGGKTPLEVADMPCINKLAAMGEVGMVQTIPEGIAPGSDAANLSVMGFDPSIYLTGRSPLEAASIGIDMNDTDVSFRTNIITLEGDGDYEDLIIKDHSSGDISTEEADQLMKSINEEFANDNQYFYTGTSYRHCLVIHNGETEYNFTPPHDVLGKPVGPNLPKGPNAGPMVDMMKKSYEILKDHPVNQARIAKGLNPANTIWIWGEGTKPKLSSFKDKYGIDGTAISAVDLIKGIAICAGLNSVDVPGATGTLHTNFEGKMEAAIKEFKEGKDFVYMHLEGPDECSHQGDMDGKISCMHDIDQKVVAPVVAYLDSLEEDYKVLVVPDHRTPLAIRTHSSDPVPYVIYDSSAQKPYDQSKFFGGVSGIKGRAFGSGYELADYFFGKK